MDRIFAAGRCVTRSDEGTWKLYNLTKLFEVSKMDYNFENLNFCRVTSLSMKPHFQLFYLNLKISVNL